MRTSLRLSRKRRSLLAMSLLSRQGKALCKELKKNFSDEISEGVADFLRGFMSERLQMEAVNRIAAASERDLAKFIEQGESIPNQGDEEDDSVDDWGDTDLPLGDLLA
mmetsp:Transcript_20860/g.67195  ORF Transcript_20860/g.67195 Transcript_20860/m.67195 type:complete len:108 (-) Transcript_20860:56-379(-)